MRTIHGWIFSIACAAMAQAPAQQTPAVELQRALYEQNTVGDLDGAIRKYREIIAANPGQRSVAAEAQYRLAQALLQKGDLNGAAQEFQILAVHHAEFENLIKSLAGRMPQPRAPIGSFEDGRFHDNATGIEFNAPAGWKLEYQGPAASEGTQAGFVDPKTGVSVAVWMKLDSTYAPKIPDMLDYDQARKHLDRDPSWTLRPESTMRTVDGQKALSAVADFWIGAGAGKSIRLTELLTWVRSPNCRAMFYGNGGPEQVPMIQNALEEMMSSARIP